MTSSSRKETEEIDNAQKIGSMIKIEKSSKDGDNFSIVLRLSITTSDHELSKKL